MYLGSDSNASFVAGETNAHKTAPALCAKVTSMGG